jgi:hypothetical protein
VSPGLAAYDELSEQLAVTRERLRILTARLEEIRLVLASSGWETSPADVFALVNAARDWRDALEAIERIVNGGEA